MSKVTEFLGSILPSEDTVGSLLYTDGKLDITKVGGVLGAAGGAFGLFSPNQPPVGYQGSIPDYTAVRQRVPSTNDPTRRPGSGGRRFFSDVSFAPEEGVAPARLDAATQVAGLKSLNVANPSRQDRPKSVIPDVPVTQGIATAANTSTPVTTVQDLLTIANPYTSGYGSPYKMAAGGIAQLRKGKYLDGSTDGMADKVPAMIDNEQPAALSDGEFVIPADVVSHLGNGNSDAGAKELETMMDKVRMARTGTKKQAPAIDPEKFLPT